MSDRRALDDPKIAMAAWGRYRRLMKWMALTGAGLVLVALAALRWWGVPMPLHMVIATSLGVWTTFMLGTALMSLAFLSSNTDHDAQIDDRLERTRAHRRDNP